MEINLPERILLLSKSFSNAQEPTLYKGWLKVYSDMITHTQGRIGEKIKEKRPGEPSDIYSYRIKNFKNITKGSIQKAISNVSRIFQAQSWSFTASKETASYLTTTTFNGMNFRQWIERYVVQNMIEDPNAIILWMPNEEGNLVPKIYNSRMIRYQDDYCVIVADKDIHQASIALMKLKQDSNIENRVFYKGETKFICASKDGIYRFEVAGASVTITPIVQSEFAFIPATTLGGIMTSAGYYESFFQSFCSFGDEAHNAFTDHQAVNVLFSYPVREEVGQPCKAKGCNGGTVVTKGIPMECDNCGGTGRVPVRSVFGVYFKPAQGIDQQNPQSAVEFRSPDVSILDYSSREWEKMLQKAEDAVQLVRIWDNQSGTAKLIDREGLYSMLTDIKNNVFDNIILKSLSVLEASTGSKIEPVVYKPNDLIIKTNADWVDEVKVASDSSMPKFVVAQMLVENLSKRFADNDYRKRIVEYIYHNDAFFVYTQAEKERLVATGLADKMLILRSILLPTILEQLASEKQNDFADITDEAIAKYVDAKMKQYEPAPNASQFDSNGNPV